MGSRICCCYCKKDEDEVIKDPVILAKIRNKEYEEYIRNSKPKKHLRFYRFNHSFNNETKEPKQNETTDL